MSVAEQITEFALDFRLADAPADVRRHLALLLLDHVAVCEAGRTAPAAMLAADHASEAHGGDAATALVDGRRVSIPGAAFANGVLANVLDYDDGHRITKGHPGAMVIPAMLATAQATDATADDFLTATLVAYDVAIRAGELLHAREAQYHASAAWGSLGVAAGCARLLDLDAAALRHAIGIAEYHAPIALMPRAVGDPAMTKDTCGWGGLIGTTSALLAARGFTGLDSEFMQADADLELGARFGVRELYLKPYPCCRWSQPGIDAALRLRADGIDPERITAVEIRTFAAAEDLSWRRPTNTEEMQYSLVWPVATALSRGVFGVDEVISGFEDPLAERLVERMRLVIDPEIDARFPAQRLTAVTVELEDGSRRTAGPLEAGGEPGDPGWEQVVARKVRRHIAADAVFPLPTEVSVPQTRLGDLDRDGLVGLLAYGVSGVVSR